MRCTFQMLMILGVLLVSTGCGGGGGGKKTSTPVTNPPVISLLPGTISSSGPVVVIPVQATGNGPLTTTWELLAGDTTDYVRGTPAADGTTTFGYVRNGTWSWRVRVYDSALNVSQVDVTVVVDAGSAADLSGRTFDGTLSAQTAVAGSRIQASWTLPGSEGLVLTTGTVSAADGTWTLPGIIVPLEEVTVTVE
jgi:hypothetical protein